MTTDTGADTGATERARDAASTAADEGRHVAGTATDEARNVAGTAADQAKNVVNDAVGQVSSQVNEQAGTQRDRLAGTLRTVGDDLDQMAQSGSGLAADLAREVSDRAKAIGSHLEGREPRELLDDVRGFARRRPGTFLVGALAAGVVAGRLFRATADGAAAAGLAEQDGSGTTGVPTYAGTPGSGLAPAVDEPGVTGTAGTPATPGTTNPPMPSVTPGHQTMDAP